VVKLLHRARARVLRILVVVAELAMVPLALLWSKRATLIETTGLVCLVVFAGSFGARWAFLVAGLYLVARAGVIEARSMVAARAKP
jgi:hypothetical protein